MREYTYELRVRPDNEGLTMTIEVYRHGKLVGETAREALMPAVKQMAQVVATDLQEEL